MKFIYVNHYFSFKHGKKASAKSYYNMMNYVGIFAKKGDIVRLENIRNSAMRTMKHDQFLHGRNENSVFRP